VCSCVLAHSIGHAPTWMIRWCLCDNTAAIASWAGMDFDGFLGRIQVARWVAMVCMAKKWLRSRTGVPARVYVHFWRWVWHAPNCCLEHQCMCRRVHYHTEYNSTCVFDISLHIWKHTLRRVCTCARTCVLCWLALGEEGGRVQLFYAGHLLLAWDVIIYMRKDEILVCIAPVFWRRWECMWVYTHLYIHTVLGVLGCEPRGLYETLGGPEESNGLNLGIYVFIHV